ncbi:alpha/beta fold hydrolase [Runella sp. MFBS21]|uniref:alpha/beta fold hydrolase n=1 Tax=Runella sp. MFBS21 TaxID=3034018 RepID=UPI0023F8532E|nr:alpha/beta fold hydrolase [Runella sp. MFBS21]MDF7821070.1 alpha/beta fold hydrolase [Runella sp. MFBS21]
MKKLILALFSAASSVFALASCTRENATPSVPFQTYVLVHGAWQASYVWEAVRADLIKNGNKVIVVELPGHGADKTPLHTLTLDVYRDKVLEAIAQLNEKVILVGHSMGGMVVSAVAEKAPARISKLVYIGAFLPTNGQALVELAFSDPDSKLGPNLIEASDKLSLDVNKENLTSLFIHDGSQAAKEKVLSSYRGEPSIPLTNKVSLTTQGFGSVEKVYIKTLQDVVVSPSLQDRMIAGAGIKTVYQINTSHSPFLSQPVEVANLLIKIGQ